VRLQQGVPFVVLLTCCKQNLLIAEYKCLRTSLSIDGSPVCVAFLFCAQAVDSSVCTGDGSRGIAFRDYHVVVLTTVRLRAPGNF